MKWYQVKARLERVQEMEALIEQNNQYYTPEDNEYLTPFNFKTCGMKFF